ncbi:MAG: DUF4160 domain-containing protein [Planctomycetota bacterium]|nr:DUF4160 domain-containing protein [Planctomycetota bacterium]
MPTIFEAFGFRFFFYSSDGLEPIHVHVDGHGAIGKWWIDRDQWEFHRGFSVRDRSKVERELRSRKQEIVDAWRAHFG